MFVEFQTYLQACLYFIFAFLFQVNNLTLLASLTLQKVLNIKNNNTTSSSSSLQSGDTQIQQKQQKHQLQQQQQLRQSLNISDNNVLSELLKNGAVFTKSVTTPTAPIAIERKRQPQHQQQLQLQHQKHQNSAQKQRLNSSISSTHSSTSTNSSYGSSSDDAAAAAPTMVTTLATPTTATTKASSIKLPEKSKIPSDILDDLASRFIINVPDMELNNLIRICFQIELAHWFYLDFFCAPAASEDGESQKPSQSAQRKLPVVGIKQFAMQLFQVGSQHHYFLHILNNLCPCPVAHSLFEQTLWHCRPDPGGMEELQAVGAHLWRYSSLRGSQSLLASAVVLREELLGLSQRKDQRERGSSPLRHQRGKVFLSRYAFKY